MGEQGEPTDVEANAGESVDPLRLDRCPECGYLLTGLPEEGICPECGGRYDPSIVMLWGWARGLRATGENTRYMVGGWLNARASMVIVVFGVLMEGMRQASLVQYIPRYMVAGVAALVVVAFSVRRRRKLLEDRPAPVQLRLVPEGFGQRDGIGPVKLTRWGRRRRLHLRYRRRGYCRIRSYGWFSLGAGRDVVDFDWPCDEVAAGRLRQRVEALHEASRECRKIHRLCRKGRLSEEEAERRVREIQEGMERQGYWRRGKVEGWIRGRAGNERVAGNG